MSSEFIDIILFGLIAIFLVYRLRSILGSTDGKIVNYGADPRRPGRRAETETTPPPPCRM